MTISSGSPTWQAVLFVLAAIYLLWETWSGWRAGVARSGMKLAAIVLSSLFGWYAAAFASMPFGGFDALGGIVVGTGVGLFVGVVVFLILGILSMILFKRTEHQSSSLIRFFWGIGGAVLGFVLALVILWGGISIIRTLGTLAESQIATAAKLTEQGLPSRSPSAIAGFAARAKASLELGAPGRLLESADPIPAEFYELIRQVGQLKSDPDAMVRFIEFPQVRDIVHSPKLAVLLNDPEVIEQCQSGNIAALMANKKLLAAVEDPELANLLRKVDFPAALKFALEKPRATSSPSPKPQVPAPR